MSLYLAEFWAQKRSLFHIISRMFSFKKQLAWIHSVKVSVFGLRYGFYFTCRYSYLFNFQILFNENYHSDDLKIFFFF